MEQLSPLLMVVVVAALLIAVLMASHIRRQRRRQAMAEWARGHGWRFRPQADERDRSSVAGLPLFERGRRRRIENLVTGDLDGFSLWLFDYRYVIGSGQHASTRRQTVVLLENPNFELPAFELRPESVLDKIGAHLGQQDIDFDAHPEFSARYLLRGEHAGRVRQRFDARLRRHFEARPGWSVEGRDRQLVAYRHRTLCAPDHLDGLLDDARRLGELFKP